MPWLVSIKNVRNTILRWEVRLLIVALAVFLFLVGLFYPGYMSADSLHQANQALHKMPLTDWHPVSMTLMWRCLIYMTGQIGSFLILQLAMFCMALYGLSLFVYLKTSQLRWAILIYGIAILPFVLSIAGVLWKDVSMGFSLLLACTLFLIAPIYIHVRWLRLACVGLGFLLLVYAGTLRYNAIFAIIPLFALVPRLVSENVSKRAGLVICSVGVGIVLLVGHALSQRSEHTYPITAIMLDDIVHIAPEVGAQTSRGVYSHIRSVCDASTSEIMNSYVLCTNENERNYIRDQHDQVMRDWLGGLMKHPLGYLRYRASVFAVFLFPDTARMYIYQNGVVDNNLGITTPSYVNRALDAYVNGFAKTNFAYTFQPWFWFTVLLSVIYYSYRQKRSIERAIILAVAFSGLLYGALYAVAAAATDYRYIYWPVLAALFCLVIIVTSYLGRAIDSKRH